MRLAGGRLRPVAGIRTSACVGAAGVWGPVAALQRSSAERAVCPGCSSCGPLSLRLTLTAAVTRARAAASPRLAPRARDRPHTPCRHSWMRIVGPTPCAPPRPGSGLALRYCRATPATALVTGAPHLKPQRRGRRDPAGACGAPRSAGRASASSTPLRPAGRVVSCAMRPAARTAGQSARSAPDRSTMSPRRVPPAATRANVNANVNATLQQRQASDWPLWVSSRRSRCPQLSCTSDRALSAGATDMDQEARLDGTTAAEHPEALRLWLRMLTCTQLIEKTGARRSARPVRDHLAAF